MFEVTAEVFEAMQILDIAQLATYPEAQLRPVLPSLVRMSLLTPLDNSRSAMEKRKQILGVLINIEVVNNIVSYLQVNYHELEQELKKELQARQKGQQVEFGLQNGIALGFERADTPRKVRVVLSEIFNIQFQLAEQRLPTPPEILDNGIYLEEVVDILCVALAELPSLLNILELADAVVNVRNGVRIICALVANFPDSYRDLVSHMIHNCDEESNEGKAKLALLHALSEMNPSQALDTRAICVDIMKVPSFMLSLCLKDSNDLIPFLTGILLGNDQNIRQWLAVYIRSSQKRKGDVLHLVRAELLNQLKRIIEMPTNSENYTVEGAVLLRLYCALRGIAGLKFNDEEINALSQLATSRPHPTPSGLRFMALALCMLIACPSLMSTTALETKAVDWLLLITDDAFVDKRAEASTSLGEMLLLLAIHFHSNQITAISELVCSTLAMKIPIRPNSTNRIKQLFTQDLFTEQVVASHAVRVPVTPDLNANIVGYLPVHCIHQLLKSRAFLKHKVPIKSWIYKQICQSVAPLHPVMPALLEVYVNSLIVPNPMGKVNVDHMHRPFTETEIWHIFRADDHKFYNVFSSYNNDNNNYDEILANVEVRCPLTSQLLILYYLVLYEDTRIAHISGGGLGGRKLKEYSNNFLSELPMKYLLQKAQQQQNDYVSLFHPLLRITISNYPHVSLVEDWLEEHYYLTAVGRDMKNKLKKPRDDYVTKSFECMIKKPAIASQVFKDLLKLPAEDIAHYADIIVKNMPRVFVDNVPRVLQDLFKNIWLRLNSIMPISFWKGSLTSLVTCNEDISSRYQMMTESMIDPLHVLRCDKLVFYNPYTLIILLRILQGSLAASKAYLNIQMQTKLILDKSGQIQSDNDREELKTALIASQESAAVHILLEVLDDMKRNSKDTVSILALRESQGIICSFIHQAFIAEPSLAKLVHFQTYPREVIPMMVKGVPSMHICIDFLHEFLSMPEIDKQIFTIELTSHLVLKYAIPRSLSVAKFCINTIQTSLAQLATHPKCKFLCNVLPSLVRFAEAFPVLIEDCINILMQAGRSLYSQSTLGINSTQLQLTSYAKQKSFKDAQRYMFMIEEAFETLIGKLINKVELY